MISMDGTARCRPTREVVSTRRRWRPGLISCRISDRWIRAPGAVDPRYAGWPARRRLDPRGRPTGPDHRSRTMAAATSSRSVLSSAASDL